MSMQWFSTFGKNFGVNGVDDPLGGDTVGEVRGQNSNPGRLGIDLTPFEDPDQNNTMRQIVRRLRTLQREEIIQDRLNADLLDNCEGADYAKLAEDETVTGDWTFSGSISFSGCISTDLLPCTDDTYDLGSSTKCWAEGYVGTVYIGDGAVGTPSLAAKNDTDTGLYFPADGEICLTTGGVDRLKLSEDGACLMNKADPEPTGENGCLYYNTTDNKIRGYEDGSWLDMISAASGTGTDNHFTRWDGVGVIQDSDLVLKDVASDIVEITTEDAANITYGIRIRPGAVTSGLFAAGDVAIVGGDGGPSGVGGSLTFDVGPTGSGDPNITFAGTNTSDIVFGKNSANEARMEYRPDQGILDLYNSAVTPTRTVSIDPDTGNDGESANISLDAGSGDTTIFLQANPSGSDQAKIILRESTAPKITLFAGNTSTFEDSLEVKEWLNVGTATDGINAGDFSAGLTGAHRFFVDATNNEWTFFNSSTGGHVVSATEILLDPNQSTWTIKPDTDPSGNASSFVVRGQEGAAGNFNGGTLALIGGATGAGSTTATAGSITFTGGSPALADDGSGGNVNFTSGTGRGAGNVSGSFNLNVGAGLVSATAGVINIGNTTATTINLSQSGQMTNIDGTLEVDEEATFGANVNLDGGQCFFATSTPPALTSDADTDSGFGFQSGGPAIGGNPMIVGNNNIIWRWSKVSGDYLAHTDSAYDIGSNSTNRPFLIHSAWYTYAGYFTTRGSGGAAGDLLCGTTVSGGGSRFTYDESLQTITLTSDDTKNSFVVDGGIGSAGSTLSMRTGEVSPVEHIYLHGGTGEVRFGENAAANEAYFNYTPATAIASYYNKEATPQATIQFNADATSNSSTIKQLDSGNVVTVSLESASAGGGAMYLSNSAATQVMAMSGNGNIVAGLAASSQFEYSQTGATATIRDSSNNDDIILNADGTSTFVNALDVNSNLNVDGNLTLTGTSGEIYKQSEDIQGHNGALWNYRVKVLSFDVTGDTTGSVVIHTMEDESSVVFKVFLTGKIEGAAGSIGAECTGLVTRQGGTSTVNSSDIVQLDGDVTHNSAPSFTVSTHDISINIDQTGTGGSKVHWVATVLMTVSDSDET